GSAAHSRATAEARAARARTRRSTAGRRARPDRETRARRGAVSAARARRSRRRGAGSRAAGSACGGGAASPSVGDSTTVRSLLGGLMHRAALASLLIALACSRGEHSNSAAAPPAGAPPAGSPPAPAAAPAAAPAPASAPEAAAPPTVGETIKLPSGVSLTHRVIGTGASPSATDRVTVHYVGTFPDGKVFDSSVERGQPATFPLNKVIDCWTEGVQHIKV